MMKSSDFSKRRPGCLLKASDGYWAFVPSPLPPVLKWNAELIGTLSEADRALGRLAGVGRTMPNPHLLIQPFMRREAVLSSRIEGTQASLSDLFLFEASPALESKAPDVKEVANYVRAMEHGLARLNELPVSLRLIRELHSHLMEGARGEMLTPGQFRRSQNWIGPSGCNLRDATYVPPPPPEMKEALHTFEKYLHSASQLPPLVNLAAVHYQFEAIHPFLDGNGRIGRLLVILLMCVKELLPQPLLYLSAYFERNRQEYYRLLLGVSQDGQWYEWIEFFLKGIVEQAGQAIELSDNLLSLRDKFRGQCHAARASSLMLKLVDELFVCPAITAAKARNILSVTPRAAQGNINKLVDAGILKEVTGQKRNRVYVAEKIIKTIEAKD